MHPRTALAGSTRRCANHVSLLWPLCSTLLQATVEAAVKANKAKAKAKAGGKGKAVVLKLDTPEGEKKGENGCATILHSAGSCKLPNTSTGSPLLTPPRLASQVSPVNPSQT